MNTHEVELLVVLASSRCLFSAYMRLSLTIGNAATAAGRQQALILFRSLVASFRLLRTVVLFLLFFSSAWLLLPSRSFSNRHQIGYQPYS